MVTTKYLHEEDIHNLTSPKEIVPVLMDLLGPRSVVDVGCGIGTFLFCFKELGVNAVKGIDGKWVDKQLLNKYLETNEFLEFDLEKKIIQKEKYDLALSLEVAEHLHEESADILVGNLISLSDTIVFSAAIPNQGGQNHINEQWLSYWSKKFARHNYKMYDILRPVFWNNENVFWWYKQNMVIFSRKSPTNQQGSSEVMSLVHPELYNLKMERLIEKENYIFDLHKGRVSFAFSIKLLAKVILRKVGLYK